jgi:PII-like signaling protein
MHLENILHYSVKEMRPMKPGDKCQLLKIYVGEDSKYKGHNLYSAVVYKLKESGIAGVTVTRAIEGYGKGKAIHTARILDLSSSLPIIIEAIDTVEQIEKVLPDISEMVNEGMIMVTDVNVIKYGKE